MYRSAPQPTRLAVAARTHTGLKRKGNLDAYFVTDFERCVARDPAAPYEVVAGLSGVAIGLFSGHLLDWSRDVSQLARAAAEGYRMGRLAVDTVVDQLVGQPPARGDASLQRRLYEVLHAADSNIRAAARDRRFIDTAASATLIVVQNERLEIAQAGDTRAYLLRGHYMAQLSRGDRIEAVPPGAVGSPPPPPNLVTRSLGSPTPIPPSLITAELRSGDVLMLCSRGVGTVLDDRQIFTTLRANPDPAEACQRLVDQSVPARGEHNITVMIARPVDATA